MVSYVKKLMKKRRKPLSASIQLTFLKRLYRMLHRGYPLTEALDLIKWDHQLKRVAESIQSSLYAGKYLDEALAKAHFHQLIIVYIYFVRVNSDLLTSLRQSIAMFEQRLQAFERFKKVSRYPLFLITIFIVLLLLIKQFILPAYLDMFQYHATSAKTVQLTLFVFNTVFTLLFVIFSLMLGIFLFWRLKKHQLSIEQQLSLLHYIPIYRHYIRLQTSFYFATHVSLFLKTGLSLKQIVQHMQRQNELPILQHYASVMMTHLKKGYHLNELLHTLPFIDRQLANIFQQDTNLETLEKDLATYADFIAETLEQRMMRLITFIQPVTFGLLGFFIVMIYVSLLWPMFQLIDSI